MIEGVIMQIAVILAEGDARVVEMGDDEIAKRLNPEAAKMGFESALSHHKWDSPEKES